MTYSIASSSLSGALPALDASALTALNATALASGTAAIGRGGTGASTLAGANIAVLNVTNTFSILQQFGGSGVSQPVTVFRDGNAGASTNPVTFGIGNGNTSQGNARLTYTNAAATGAPTFSLGFFPRNNADSSVVNPGNLTFTKTAAADTCVVALTGSGSGKYQINADGTLTLTGAAGFSSTVTVSGTAATISSGTGSPEGVKTAAVGSLYMRTDGGASTCLYVKESGAGNTGWVAK